jgi:CxxC motif-containing protein (DUF1111 family)
MPLVEFFLLLRHKPIRREAHWDSVLRRGLLVLSGCQLCSESRISGEKEDALASAELSENSPYSDISVAEKGLEAFGP